MKITQRATHWENRADLDAKLVYLVLASPHSHEQIINLLQEQKNKDFTDLVVKNFIEAAQSLKSNADWINTKPVK